MRAMAPNKSENNEEESEPGALQQDQMVGTQSNIQGGRQRFKGIIR